MNTTSNYHYQVGGSLERNAPSYGVRQADEDFYQALKAGEFCYVLNSRQMGKSSLRVRTVGRLEAERIACSQIDITSIGSRGITAAEWYWGVVRRLARSFKTSVDLKTWWQERAEASPVDRLSQFIEEVLLVEVRSSIAIFVDEIDSILNLDFKDDFFALIRTCYNQRAENPEYRRLTFALLGVATPSDLIQDKSRTPFNIGRSIDLRGLQLHEAEPLAQGLQEKAEDAIAVLKSILDWTDGQPFLTQKICQFVQSETDWIPAGQEAEQVRSLVQSHVIENWEGKDEPEHLRTIRNRVTRDDRKGQLLGLYQQVLEKGAIPATESEEQIQLRLSGLVVKDQGQLKPHNRIYAAVFDRAWAERILAELRPYAEAIAIWLKSDGQDESRLLRGNALEEAQRWATNKHLGEQDVRFLSASEQAEKRVMVEEKRILTEVNRRANRRLKMTGGLLGLAVVMAGGSGLWASHASVNAKRAEQEQRSAEAETQKANAETQKAEAETQKANAETQKANKSLETVKAELVSTKNLAKSAKEQEQQAKANLQTAKQEQQKAESELKESSQRLQAANQNLTIAEQELATVREQSKQAEERAIVAAARTREVEAKRSVAEKRLADAISAYHNAYSRLGFILDSQNKLDEAVEVFSKAIALNPNDASSYALLGYVFEKQNRQDEAVEAYQKAIRLDPENVLAYNGLGNMLYEQNRLDEAAEAYRKVIRLDPIYELAYNGLGNVLTDQKKLDEAVETYRKAIDLNSKYTFAYNGLGNALKEQNKLDEAVEAYRKAIELDPKQEFIYYSLGDVLVSQNKLAQALEAYQNAVALNPKYAPAIGNIGRVYHLQGRNPEALEQVNRAIELDPNLKWAIELRDKIQKLAP